MTDTQGGEAAAVETTPQAAPEAASSSQEVDFEAEARKMGWVPEAEFKGDHRPAKFLSAEEYYRRGEEVIPIIRARNKDLEKEIEGLKETNKRMSAMFEKTAARIKAEYEGKIDALKAEKRAAIREGDEARVEHIDAQIETLKDAAQDGKDPSLEPQNKDHNALVRDFARANAWFVEEPEMHDYAVRVSESNAALNDGISFEDNMKFVVGAIRKKFPGYFKDTTAANGHAAVDAGGSFPGAQPPKGPSSKLNSTELAQARKDVAAGLYKNTDAWAEVYFAK